RASKASAADGPAATDLGPESSRKRRRLARRAPRLRRTPRRREPPTPPGPAHRAVARPGPLPPRHLSAGNPSVGGDREISARGLPADPRRPAAPSVSDEFVVLERR